MKVLIVADEESKYLWDHYAPGRLEGIDMILSCGDLKQEYLEFLVTMSNRPCYYVPGNHDKGYAAFPPEGCECVDDRIVDVQGLRILGLGGCIRYNQGPFQYTEKEMMRRIRKLRWKLWRAGGVDIILFTGGAGENQWEVREGATVISTSTRNFPNRLGPGTQVYLGSAELTAIASRLGRLPSKEEYLREMHVIDQERASVYRYMNFDQIPEYAAR